MARLFRVILQHEKLTVSKPLIFSITAILRYELPPKKFTNPSGHMHPNLTNENI